MSSYLTNLASMQTPLTVAGSIFSGAAVAKLKNYPIKDAAIISGVTGFAASVTTSALDPETKTIYKVLLAAATVIGTLVALQSASKYLESKFGFVIEPKLMSYLTIGNIVGVAVSFAVYPAKPLLDVEAFDKLDDDAVRALHARMLEDGNKEFSESSTLLQLRMLQRFEALEPKLDISQFEAKLTADSIKELSKAEVEYLFKFRLEEGEGKPAKTWTFWVKDNEEAKSALVERFVEFRFINKTISKEDLAAALKARDEKLPITPEEIQALSTTDAAFFRAVYKALPEKWAELSIVAQWALSQAKPADLMPNFTAENIKDAPKAAIEWFLGEVEWLSLTRGVQEALLAKCGEEGIECKAALNPKTVKEVTELSEEAVKAYFPYFANPKYADSISDDVVAAFMARFYELELKASDLPLEVFTPARIAKIHLPASGPEAEEAQLPAAKLPWIHRIYQALPENWYALYEKDRHAVLERRFKEAKLEALFMPKREAEPLPTTLSTSRHHAAFARGTAGDAAWRVFTKSQQNTFNERFANAKLEVRRVTSWIN